MGSFCKPSKVTTTSSSSTSALPEYAAAYKSLIPQYQQAGSAAYDPATEQSVAGFTAPQMQAFQGVQNNQGVYQPYLGAAAGLTAQGAGPAAGGIGAYINPFTQNVVNAALDDWQEQSGRTMQQVNSNAASIGALTGDRSQVAQQLAREAGDRAMSSNIANLYQQGFNTALGAAQNDQNRYLAAGQQFAGLGGLAQQYGYQDVNALMQAGGMQQAQTQAELDAASQNAQTRAQYPMYMLDWQRQGLTGLGGAAGSNSTGTQTAPGPSMFQQVAGLGLSAAGLYNNWGKKDGGRVETDGIVPPGNPIADYYEQRENEAGSFIPLTGTASGGLSLGALMSLIAGEPIDAMILGAGAAGMAGATAEAQERERRMRSAADMWFNRFGDNPNQGLPGSPSGPAYRRADGGAVPATGGLAGLVRDVGMAADGLSNIRRKCGGRVGYMDGGEVEDETSPFAYYNPNPTQTGVAVKPRPPALTAPPVQSKEIGPWGTSVVPAGMSKLGASDVVSADDGLGNLGLSSDAGTALMAAGFGMMSSTSPHALAAAGEGGLAGLQMYNALADRRKREALLKAKEAEGKTFEMGGRLVRALPDGTVQEIYTAPEKPMDPLERRMKLAQISKLEREASGEGGGDADKTPAGRAALARSLGVEEGSDAFNAYVMTGKLPREDQQRLTVTDKKAILEADETVIATEGAIASLMRAKELSKTAYDGATANERAYITSQFGSQAGKDTVELRQAVTEGALQQLKAIFGGMPTEGERKVLLEVQGSAELPQSVREAIYDRALALANKRLAFNKARAEELRGGSYYKPNDANPAPAPNNAPQDLVWNPETGDLEPSQ